MSGKVGIRALAREIGVSHEAVRKAIEDGRLKGSVSRRGRHYEIDVDLAKSEWAANTNAAKQRSAVRQKSYSGPGPLFDPNAPAGARAARAAEQEQPAGGGPTLTQSRTLKEAYMARLARLQYQQMEGALVDVQAVKRERFESGKAVREAVMALPGQLAPELIGSITQQLADQLEAAGIEFDFAVENVRGVQLLLEQRLTEALEVLARGRIDGTHDQPASS